MFFASWVLDWFVILNLATLGVTLAVYLLGSRRADR
jgi:hypothetical protein|tara:strand:- start:3746 stop:3853 length:108 start_codon:yes stop_codon:yes gene_type:complete